MLECPIDECDAGPWPDTKGAHGGQRKRFIHVYTHRDELRGIPFKQIDRL